MAALKTGPKSVLTTNHHIVSLILSGYIPPNLFQTTVSIPKMLP